MAKSKLKVDWVVLKGDSMLCTRCGIGKKLFPCPVDEIPARLDRFSNEHYDCLPSPASLDIQAQPYEKPVDWIVGDDTGTSSVTIWAVMMGAKAARSGVPHDPSDFGRCYRLLRAFPEWRARMPEVAKTYPAWAPFVEKWDQLTALFEEEVQRKDGKAPKLYEFIQGLRK